MNYFKKIADKMENAKDGSLRSLITPDSIPQAIQDNKNHNPHRRKFIVSGRPNVHTTDFSSGNDNYEIKNASHETDPKKRPLGPDLMGKEDDVGMNFTGQDNPAKDFVVRDIENTSGDVQKKSNPTSSIPSDERPNVKSPTTSNKSSFLEDKKDVKSPTTSNKSSFLEDKKDVKSPTTSNKSSFLEEDKKDVTSKLESKEDIGTIAGITLPLSETNNVDTRQQSKDSSSEEHIPLDGSNQDFQSVGDDQIKPESVSNLRLASSQDQTKINLVSFQQEQRQQEEETTVTINIGRIEVRMPSAIGDGGQTQSTERLAFSPVLSLEEYLKRRTEGRKV